jgi:plastocyanin
MRIRRTLGASALLAIAAGTQIPAATALGGAHAARTRTVVLQNIAFHPATLSIHRGDAVTWMWRDGQTQHNVTGAGFKSRTMTKGSFTVRFSKRGTFNYRCTIHASFGMRGKIVVR